MISTMLAEEGQKLTAQHALVAKFARVWEKKNSRAAKMGGTSLMALSLAACGGGSDPADDPVNLEGAGTTSTHVIQRTTTDYELVWDGQFTDEVDFGGSDIADLFDNNAMIADYVAPILTTEVTNDGVVFGRTTSAADDQIYADGFAMHGAVIDGGAGTDTVYVDMKAAFAQPLAVVNVEHIEIVNVQNIYENDAEDISALEDEENRDVADSADSEIDLFKVIGLESVTISEGANANGDLDVWNVSGGTTLTFEGHFEGDVRVDYMDSMAAVDVTLSNVSTDGDIEVSHNAKTMDLTSTGGGVNDVDASAFGDHLRTLNITGDTELNVDLGNAIAFDADRTATINAEGLSADLIIGVAAHTDVSYTGTDVANGVDLLMVTAAADSGEDRMTLNADFGAGTAAGNYLVYNLADADIDYLNSASTISSDTAGGVTLRITGDNGGTLDATRVADVTSIGAVVFDTTSQLHMTAAQVNEIGIANFSSQDYVNDDGQLVITNVSSTTDLALGGIDNGELIAVRTADASDVTLTAATVLGNLQSGVGEVQIMAETGDASLTMTADQFEQIDDDEIVVVGIDGEGAPGNNPVDNTPYEGSLRITDVAANETLALANVTVDGVTIEVGAAGAEFTATSAFSIIDGGGSDEAVTLEISGTVDLTSATLTGVDSIVLLNGATLTATEPFLDGVDISGDGTINVPGAGVTLDLNSTTETLDLENINFVFTGTGAATLEVSGAAGVTIESVSTTAGITALTIDNQVAAGQTLTITGASPAINLHADTTALTIDDATPGGSVANALVIGTESDDAATAAVEPSITGSGLSAITIQNGVAGSTVDLGVVGGVADVIDIDGSGHGGDAAPSVQLDTIPASADWTIDGMALTVNTGASIGAGSSLNLAGNTTLAGTLGKDALPIAPDSTLVITSTYTAAEITALLDTVDGSNGAEVVATGMSADQLTALAAQPEKLGAALTGTLALNKDVSAADMGTLSTKFAGGGEPTVTVVATGMSAAQLTQVNGLAGDIDPDGITGTYSLDSDNSGNIAGLLADTIRSANVSIDAADMTAADLEAIAGNISTVDSLTNLTYEAGADTTAIGGADDGLEARALLNATSEASVTGTGLSTAEKLAIAENIDSVASGGIASLALIDTDATSTISTLLTKATAATVDAGDSADAGAATMSVAQLSAVAAGAAGVGDINNLTVTSSQTAAEITALLGVVADEDATATVTGMSADQVTAVAGTIDSVGTVGGVTTVAVITELNTADSELLDATDVTDISGTLSDLQSMADTSNSSGVDTLDIDETAVNFDVTDAAGTAIAIADLTALDAETAGTVAVANAVTISGSNANLTATLIEAAGADGTVSTAPGHEDGDDGVIATTANITIDDAADGTMTAVSLADLGSTTSGTVTVENAQTITGSGSNAAGFAAVSVTAALVTADTKVVAADSNVTIDTVATINTESDQQVIEDIDAATTGTITLQGTAADNEINMAGYAGGALTIEGGNGADTITGTSNADTITGGAGDDIMTGGAGNDTYIFAGDITAGDDIVEAAAGGTDTISTSAAGGNVSFVGLEYGGTADAALTEIEQVLIDAGTIATFSGTQLTGLAININEDDTGTTTLDINVGTGTTADFSNLTFTAASGAAFDDGGDVIDIDGAAGAETITGTSIADNIATGAGADTVTGGAGDDTIDLGASDTAADVVVFSAAATNGLDSIDNFETTVDHLNLDGVMTGVTDVVGVEGIASTANIATYADNEVYVFADGDTASAGAGTATITTYTNLTEVADFLSESFEDAETALVAGGGAAGGMDIADGDENVFVINDLGNSLTYVYAFAADGAGDASGGAAITAAELTHIGTVTEDGGNALVVADIL